MSLSDIDDIIENKLTALQEEKYKLRIFAIEMHIRIDPDYGIEESLQGIRSISGVTVVTAMDSVYRGSSSSYLSHIKIKFHPRKDSTPPMKFLKRTLLPGINSLDIPGVKVVRIVGTPEQIQ
jgi:tRNA (Thr-GGU) A37 N-methylase